MQTTLAPSQPHPAQNRKKVAKNKLQWCITAQPAPFPHSLLDFCKELFFLQEVTYYERNNADCHCSKKPFRKIIILSTPSLTVAILACCVAFKLSISRCIKGISIAFRGSARIAFSRFSSRPWMSVMLFSLCLSSSESLLSSGSLAIFLMLSCISDISASNLEIFVANSNERSALYLALSA
jgi:hypothetical protein